MMKKLEKSKTLCIVVLIILICLLKPHPGLADVMGDPRIGGSGGNSVVAMYPSPLTVIEIITDIGGGSYRYEYAFVNTDASPIWHLSVDTTFVTAGAAQFTGHSLWGAATNPIGIVLPQFDSRNLNPDIIHTAYTYTWPWVDAVKAIQIGEVVSGFSFTATTYDPSPKLYVYETIASGYAWNNGTGQVAAVGQTVAEVTNTAPVADAGEDQVLLELTAVQLGTDEGRQSYDPDGDDITYLWTITGNPAFSGVNLDNPASATPTFQVDCYGEYQISLVVTDIHGAMSQIDTVTVSFNNVKPAADAGVNQAVDQGDTVLLDGSASDDANGDELSYSWIFVSVPDGSSATLSDAGAVNPTFTADKPGAYEVGLVVNDGLLDSEPAIVSIVAISGQSASIDMLLAAAVNVNSLDPAEFKNKNMKDTFTKKINAVIGKIDEGLYAEALDKLKNDVLKKTDGCAENGEPDKNDWIKDCEAQGVVYPLIVEAIDLLSQLV